MGVEVETYDPNIDEEEIELGKKIYFIGCGHKIFKEYKFVEGSHVIDPHRYLPKLEGVTYTEIGIGPRV